MAGVWYFYPFVTGRQLRRKLGIWSFWLMFAGFNIAFLPMHLTGLRGMPRRVFTYPVGMGFDALNLVSTIGALILAAGLAVVFSDMIRSKKRQP
jgi:heme/copper-type cytochrome/quinol oxidase subunit 1